ncbi:MAG: NUDIX domain-containing protein [Actinobacteria bacterium]|nr:NUDIX domain-containing protein [Actinomycetota bacterium]
MDRNPIVRPSARVILIGPGRRVLMFRGGDPWRPDDGTWWVAPGGGIEPGEATEAAARRELIEETGQVEVEWGGMVATRNVRFQFMGNHYHADESVFVAYTDDRRVRPSITDLELENIEEHRWLSADELEEMAEPVYRAHWPKSFPISPNDVSPRGRGGGRREPLAATPPSALASKWRRGHHGKDDQPSRERPGPAARPQGGDERVGRRRVDSNRGRRVARAGLQDSR